ncbi:MAG: ParB N-terminal domain-containing protein, partial [Terriglobus sp.]
MADAKANDPKRRALGRGLEALLPSKPLAAPAKAVAPPPAAPAAPSGKPLEVDVKAIERNPFQTRTRFDEEALNELTQSVAATGVVQPIVV